MSLSSEQICLSLSDLRLLGMLAMLTMSMLIFNSELSQVQFQSPPMIMLEFLSSFIPFFNVSKKDISSSFGP